MESYEELAFAATNLTPRELMDLQPHEFYKICEGVRLRREYNARFCAYFTTILISPHCKRGSVPSPEKLAAPFLQKQETNIDDLRAEKEHYMKMYKEISNVND